MLLLLLFCPSTLRPPLHHSALSNTHPSPSFSTPPQLEADLQELENRKESKDGKEMRTAESEQHPLQACSGFKPKGHIWLQLPGAKERQTNEGALSASSCRR